MLTVEYFDYLEEKETALRTQIRNNIGLNELLKSDDTFDRTLLAQCGPIKYAKKLFQDEDPIVRSEAKKRINNLKLIIKKHN